MIRSVTAHDADAVYGLMCQLEDCELPREPFDAIFGAQLAAPGQHAFVYVSDDADPRVLGFINMRIEGQLHHAADIAEIMELVVDETARSGGIGGALFARACEAARDAGCEQIELTSNARRHDAHRFYENHGMTRTHVKFVMPF